MPPETCPNCGADIPAKAKVCPECGSDDSTGWADSAHADNLGLPDENFDYERFVKEEFGGAHKPHGISWLWWLTALLLAGLLLFFYFR